MQALFAEGDLSSSLQAELAKTRTSVDAVAPDVLLDATIEELVVSLVDACSVELLNIDWASAWSPGPQETTLDVQHNWQYAGGGEGRTIPVPADEVAVHVPFTGDPMLLRLRPSQWSSVFPRAEIGDSELIYHVIGPSLKAEEVTRQFNAFRASASSYAQAANADVRQFNARVEDHIRRLVTERRSRLMMQRRLTAELPFQLRPVGARATYTLPIRRTNLHLTRNPVRPFEPEPALQDAIYEDVLGRIAAFGRMVERLPNSVGAMNEEGLRDHLLLLLNGTYEGQVAGEIFNRHGKTDILLRSGDRNVFIAECKIWDGSTKFARAIDQLLSYLVWRDGKAALVLFIRAAKPSEVVRRADAAIAAHPQCLHRDEPVDMTSRVDYLLRSTADPERSVRTALLPVAISQSLTYS